MRARRPEGFTLVELLVTLVIASIVLTAILGVFYAQVKRYAAEQYQRTAQSGAREGVAYLERTIRAAGYGVEPSRALLAYDGFNADSPTQIAPDPTYPDAIVLHQRDLRFQRALASGGVSATQLRFDAALGVVYPGQIFLVLCQGALQSAYVTVAAQTAADTVSLQPASAVTRDSPVGWPGPQFHQEATLAAGCFQGPGVVGLKVQRAAFFVRGYPDDPGGAGPVTPYLMLHQGLDLDGSGTVDVNDAVPIAARVEQLQVAYMMDAVPPTCPTPAIHGVTDSPPWGLAWRTGTGPTLDTSYADPSRCSDDVANVRQVRVSVVARGGRVGGAGDDALTGDGSTGTLGSGTVAWKPLENLATPVAPFVPSGGGFRRTVIRLAVSTPNLAMRSQFLPLLHGG